MLCLDAGQLATALPALEQACAWLVPTGSAREIARARLHLAEAYLRAGERERAIELAREALGSLPAGPRDPLLAAEGRYVAAVLVERRLRIEGCTGDLIAPALPLGQAIGRLGNFLAGDAYGLPTGLPWGVTMAGAARHPVQFYEAALDLILFALIWRWRRRPRRDGDVFRLYVVGYALIRFPLEFLRYQPTPRAFLDLTLVQWLCLASIAGFGYQLFLSSRGATCICDLLPGARQRSVVR